MPSSECKSHFYNKNAESVLDFLSRFWPCNVLIKHIWRCGILIHKQWYESSSTTTSICLFEPRLVFFTGLLVKVCASPRKDADISVDLGLDQKGVDLIHIEALVNFGKGSQKPISSPWSSLKVGLWGRFLVALNKPVWITLYALFF